MTTNNHPAHGPVSLDRLHQIREILSKAAAQSDGGNLGYAMADAVKVIDGAIAAFGAEPVAWKAGSRAFVTRVVAEMYACEIMAEIQPLYITPPATVVPDALPENDDEDGNDIDYLEPSQVYELGRVTGWNACRAAMLQGAEPVINRDELPEEKGASLQLRNLIRQRHAEWSDKTFGNVGPVGPLKHLSKEALEAAASPEDLSEWADIQFLLWDAQRRAGISDEQITLAMVDKLAVNKQREWPEPKDGEPRLHIKEGVQEVKQ